MGVDYLRDVSARLKIPLVSCNVLDGQGRADRRAARVVTAAGRTLAFIGVLSRATRGIGPPNRAAARGDYRALDRLRKEHTIDAVVVLAYLPTEELRELAATLPEVDLVVGGPTGQSIPPQQIGPTMLASATNKGKFLARFDQPARSEAAKSRQSWRGQIVEMNATLHDDAKQQENLKQFYAELERRDFSPNQTSFVTPLPPDLPKDYAIAGSESCRRCHAGDCQSWAASKHAAAWKTLAKQGRPRRFLLPAVPHDRLRPARRVPVGLACPGARRGRVRKLPRPVGRPRPRSKNPYDVRRPSGQRLHDLSRSRKQSVVRLPGLLAANPPRRRKANGR